MYEGKETSIRGIVVTVLLIILVICILIWIFPTKKDIKGISGANNEPLLNEIFGHNLKILQNAGRAYYYSAALPKNNGEKTSITLSKLVEKKMLLEFKDKNGKACDGDASYAQLTKKDSEHYELKAYLKCGDEADYILDILGCSDIKNNCKSSIISKDDNKKEDNKKDNDIKEEDKKEEYKDTYISYRYLYSCPKNTQTYSDWSSWSTNYITNTSNRIVDTKVEYENKYVKTGTKQEAVTTYETKEEYETVEEEKTYVNTIPEGARNCITIPRSGYTLYRCKIQTQKPVTKQVPVVNYNTVDVYEWQSTPVTYYRYKTLINNNETYEVWSTQANNSTYRNMGCTIIKSERVAN